MNFDPTLKKAIMEIEGILRKYDIAGAISLTSKTHGEYLFVLDPTWSIIKQIPQEDGTMMHIKSLRKDFESEAAQHEANELTAHLIWSQADVVANTLRQLERIKAKLSEKWKVAHNFVEPQKTEHFN